MFQGKADVIAFEDSRVYVTEAPYLDFARERLQLPDIPAGTLDAARFRFDFTVDDARTGQRLHLMELVEDLKVEDDEDELAVRITVTLRNERWQDGRYVHQLLPLGARVHVWQDYGNDQWRREFEGIVFRWRESPLQRGYVQVVAYDPLIYLRKSEDELVYEPGKTGAEIIRDLATRWKIPVHRIDGPNVALPQFVVRGSIASAVWDVLQTSRLLGGGRFVLRWRYNGLECVKAESNETVYVFSTDTNAEDVMDEWSIEELVTRVIVVGTSTLDDIIPGFTDPSTPTNIRDRQTRDLSNIDNLAQFIQTMADNNPSRERLAVVTGDTRFGVLQQVLVTSKTEDLDQARKEAELLLKERGKPLRRPTVRCAADLMFLRRGDRVKVVGGTLNGYFRVSAVEHLGSEGMEMVLEESER